MRHRTLPVTALPILLLVSACRTLPARAPAPPPAPHSPFVVFDIDGTLTPHNLLVFQARPAAAAVARALARDGYQPVYITTRRPGLQTGLPEWLQEHGFPAGPLHTAQTSEERDDPAAYKLGVLRSYQSLGWELALAFGDSPTDFEAYRQAGLPVERVFALQRKWSSDCEPGEHGHCLQDWGDYLNRYGAHVPDFIRR